MATTLANYIARRKAGIRKGLAAQAQATHAFTPYQAPSTAPAGSYDPAYDAQLENANQGFDWTAQDYVTGQTRLNGDYGTATDRQAHDYGQAKDYLGQDHASALANLLTSRNRGVEDYGTATGNLQRNYLNLGTQQSAQARSAGAGEGGALAQALLKRQANQGRDQSGLDTQQARFLADNTTRTDQENQGFQRQSDALDLSNQRGTEDLGQNYFRGSVDAGTGYQRAGIQNATFGRQLNAEKLAIAAQNGGLPLAPENEHTYKGITYRTEVHNGKTYRRLPNGRLVPTTQKLASAI